jgi:hypothetical protein
MISSGVARRRYVARTKNAGACPGRGGCAAAPAEKYNPADKPSALLLEHPLDHEDLRQQRLSRQLHYLVSFRHLADGYARILTSDGV